MGKCNYVSVICGVVAFGAPFTIYLATVAPGVTFEDSGQLITAAAVLGVCHPSGYPILSLVGNLFTLIPKGSVAWRVNLSSAIAASFAALILYLICRRLFLTTRPSSKPAAELTATAAAVAFGLSKGFWSQAVVTEAYTFNALASALTVYAGFKFLAASEVRWGYFAAFAAGLALGAHTSSVVVTAPLAGYIAWRTRRLPSLKTACFTISLFLLGTAVYLYLPLRASQGPPLNWGDPRTLKLAYYHITRHAYGGPRLERLEFFPYHLREFAGYVFKEFGIPGTVAGLVGFAAALYLRRRPWDLFAITLVITGPITVLTLVLLLQGHQIGEIHIWYIPFFMVAAPFVGLGMFAVAELVRGRGLKTAAAGALGVAVVASAFATNIRFNDNRHYYFAEDFGRNLLRTISYGGVNLMFERASVGTFECAYLKMVEKRRPDHRFIDATGTVFREFERFAEVRLAPTPAAASWERAFEKNIVDEFFPRGVYYSLFRDHVYAYGYVIEPAGMLYKIFKTPPMRSGPSPVWKSYKMRGVRYYESHPDDPRVREEEWVRDTICIYRFMYARELFLAGQPEKATAVLKRVEPLAGGLPESLADMGNIYFLNGYYREAVRLYNLAVRAFPRQGKGDPAFRLRYAQILNNKAVALIYLGDVDGAEAAYRASYEAYPDQPGITEIMKRENIAAAVRELAR